MSGETREYKGHIRIPGPWCLTQGGSAVFHPFESTDEQSVAATLVVEVPQPRKWSGERRIHSAPCMDEASDKRWILLPCALRDLPERSTVKVTIETTD